MKRIAAVLVVLAVLAGSVITASAADTRPFVKSRLYADTRPF